VHDANGQVFLKPLKAQQLLEPLAIASLFSNILYIISINEELIGGLVKLQGQSPAQICVGSLFLSLVRVSCSAVPSDDAVLVVVDLAYAFGRRYSSPTISKCMYSTVPISRQHYQRLSRTRNKTSTITIAICDCDFDILCKLACFRRFNAFIEQAREDPLCHGLPIEIFLAKPAEHMLLYPGLLRVCALFCLIAPASAPRRLWD